MGSLEEEVLLRLPCFVEDGDGVGDVGAEALEGGVGFFNNGFCGEGGELEFFEDFVHL